MKRAQQASIARQTLDERFALGTVAGLVGRPPRGWVRAIRDALGMSTRELGARMGVSHNSVVDIERSEAAGVIKLETLRRAADALGCDLVYALVPRISLDATAKERARELAVVEIARVDRTMALEDQRLRPEQLERRVDVRAAELLETGRLWSVPLTS
jgi:predicted DNA-binding mobile mystery protein A